MDTTTHTTTPTPDEIARRLSRSFLIPALTIADWRVKYREINRAAGVLVGAVMCGMDCEALLRETRARLVVAEGGAAIFEALEKRVGEISQALISA